MNFILCVFEKGNQQKFEYMEVIIYLCISGQRVKNVFLYWVTHCIFLFHPSSIYVNVRLDATGIYRTIRFA